MKPKAFSHIYSIEEDNLKGSVVEITTEDPDCKANCEVQIPFYLLEDLHRYLGERIEYLRNHNLLPHES